MNVLNAFETYVKRISYMAAAFYLPWNKWIESWDTSKKMHKLKFGLLLHALRPLNLTVSNYYLFANAKRMLQAEGFLSNNQIIMKTVEGDYGLPFN